MEPSNLDVDDGSEVLAKLYLDLACAVTELLTVAPTDERSWRERDEGPVSDL